MKRITRLSAFVALIAAVGLNIAGCGGSSGNNSSPTPAATPPVAVNRGEAVTPPRTVNGLTFVMSASKPVYKPEDSIAFSLSVTNSTDKTVTTYSSSFNNGFYVKRNGVVIGDYTQVAGGGQGITYVFAPGETKVIDRTFIARQHSDDPLLKPGVYQIKGWLVGNVVDAPPAEVTGDFYSESGLSSAVLQVTVAE